MSLRDTVSALFGVVITQIKRASDIAESDETPMLLAREAAKGILAKHSDEPVSVCECEEGFVVVGRTHAVMIENAGAVRVKPLGNASTDEAFKPGQKVKHKKHGKGKVHKSMGKSSLCSFGDDDSDKKIVSNDDLEPADADGDDDANESDTVSLDDLREWVEIAIIPRLDPNLILDDVQKFVEAQEADDEATCLRIARKLSETADVDEDTAMELAEGLSGNALAAHGLHSMTRNTPRQSGPSHPARGVHPSARRPRTAAVVKKASQFHKVIHSIYNKAQSAVKGAFKNRRATSSAMLQRANNARIGTGRQRSGWAMDSIDPQVFQDNIAPLMEWTAANIVPLMADSATFAKNFDEAVAREDYASALELISASAEAAGVDLDEVEAWGAMVVEALPYKEVKFKHVKHGTRFRSVGEPMPLTGKVEDEFPYVKVRGGYDGSFNHRLPRLRIFQSGYKYGGQFNAKKPHELVHVPANESVETVALTEGVPDIGKWKVDGGNRTHSTKHGVYTIKPKLSQGRATGEHVATFQPHRGGAHVESLGTHSSMSVAASAAKRHHAGMTEDVDVELTTEELSDVLAPFFESLKDADITANDQTNIHFDGKRQYRDAVSIFRGEQDVLEAVGNAAGAVGIPFTYAVDDGGESMMILPRSAGASLLAMLLGSATIAESAEALSEAKKKGKETWRVTPANRLAPHGKGKARLSKGPKFTSQVGPGTSAVASATTEDDDDDAVTVDVSVDDDADTDACETRISSIASDNDGDVTGDDGSWSVDFDDDDSASAFIAAVKADKTLKAAGVSAVREDLVTA